MSYFSQLNSVAICTALSLVSCGYLYVEVAEGEEGGNGVGGFESDESTPSSDRDSSGLGTPTDSAPLDSDTGLDSEQSSDPCEPYTVTIEMDGTNGKDAPVIFLDDPPNDRVMYNKNFGAYVYLRAAAWTYQGEPYNFRSLIQLDLPTPASGALLETAALYLFASPDDDFGDTMDAHLQTTHANDARLERITEEWDELTVTWENQPDTTAEGAISLPPSDTPDQDYIIDVTSLVQGYLNRTYENYGFLLRLTDETTYAALSFASRETEYPDLRPRMTLVFTCE